MGTPLDASYSQCRRITRDSATSFYYSFLLLGRDQRRSMCALYAFLRRTDDLGDGPETLAVRREAVTRWRSALRKAWNGDFDDPILPALADTVERHSIPREYLEAVIDGVEMDLAETHYETFDDLALYCHRVASVVGLACIHIWGFRGEEAFEPARQCGLAFQLTNILRDLKEDAQRGRVYLPAEDLRRFDCTPADLESPAKDGRFQALMRFEIERAEGFYRQAQALPQWLAPAGRAVYGAMWETYRSLLAEIKRRDGDVFTSRVRLSAWRKLRIAARSLLASPSRARADNAVGVLRR